MTMKKETLMNWIELSQENLIHNIEVIRSFCGRKTSLSALLKANAYGHGIEPMAELFVKGGIDCFIVHSFDEALRVKATGFGKRIIIIGPQTEEQIKTSLQKGFEIILYTFESLEILKTFSKTFKKPIKLHVKIETGTQRQGVILKDLPPFIQKLKQIKNLRLKGISSHFANIEDTSDTAYYKHQMSLFNQAHALFVREGLIPEERHIACSAAVLLYPETLMERARPGIALYGYLSSPELAFALKLPRPLKPVLSWKTRIAQIKIVDQNEGVGYGLTYQTTRETRLGILPIGYYDGFDRRFSNLAYVLVHGKRAPVRGRICMNLCMVDLTDIPEASVMDEVTVIGTSGKEVLTADHLATWAHTISYEILARLNPSIPKRIL